MSDIIRHYLFRENAGVDAFRDRRRKPEGVALAALSPMGNLQQFRTDNYAVETEIWKSKGMRELIQMGNIALF